MAAPPCFFVFSLSHSYEETSIPTKVTHKCPWSTGKTWGHEFQTRSFESLLRAKKVPVFLIKSVNMHDPLRIQPRNVSDEKNNGRTMRQFGVQSLSWDSRPSTTENYSHKRQL